LLRPKRGQAPEPMGPGGGGYDPSKRRGGMKRRRGP
jgi:excinuclease ABC subunit B